MTERSAPDVSDVTARLAAYIAVAADTPLPDAVAAKTRLHTLDTLAAMLSGSRLEAGRLACRLAAKLGGVPEATLIGTPYVVSALDAALANGMSGHADETDDSHLAGRFHPGCAIVPAALAIAERQGASGARLVRAVALGYDVGARLNLSLGYRRPDTTLHSTHSLGATFGATAACAALLALTPEQVRWALSYAAQQASGIPFWNRDSRHVEKAFDFGGMGARNGVLSALVVSEGFSAVDDPFAGAHSVFTAFAENAQPSRLIEGLGERFEIEAAAIKTWCVGSPIQAVLDAVAALQGASPVRASEIASIAITLPDDRIHIVDDRDMPDVCVQHLAALAIVDGTLTFESCHDAARMRDPAVLDVRRKIQLVPSPELTTAKPARQAIVEIMTANGETLRHHARAVRGTPENPMTPAEVEAKALDLVTPVIGAEKAARLVECVRRLDGLPSVLELRAVLRRVQ